MCRMFCTTVPHHWRTLWRRSSRSSLILEYHPSSTPHNSAPREFQTCGAESALMLKWQSLKQKRPNGVMKVVRRADSGERGSCQNPELASSFKNTIAPASWASVWSTAGIWCLSLHTFWFSPVRSTQILTLSSDFGTTTIPAHGRDLPHLVQAELLPGCFGGVAPLFCLPGPLDGFFFALWTAPMGMSCFAPPPLSGGCCYLMASDCHTWATAVSGVNPESNCSFSDWGHYVFPQQFCLVSFHHEDHCSHSARRGNSGPWWTRLLVFLPPAYACWNEHTQR